MAKKNTLSEIEMLILSGKMTIVPDNKFTSADGTPLKVHSLELCSDSFEIGDEIMIPKDYKVYLTEVNSFLCHCIIVEVKSKPGTKHECQFFPNCLAKHTIPIDEKGRRLPRVKTSGPVAMWYAEQDTVDNAMIYLAGKTIVVKEKKVYTIKDYTTKEFRTTSIFTFDWKGNYDKDHSQKTSAEENNKKNIISGEGNHNTEKHTTTTSINDTPYMDSKKSNEQIDNMMRSVITSTFKMDESFNLIYWIDYFRSNPFKARKIFCSYTSEELSEKCFKNKLQLIKIFEIANKDKYCIDYYDVICLFFLCISSFNKDYWSVVRFCEEIIETTKDDNLLSRMLKYKNDTERLAGIATLNGYTNDALKYFVNPNDFEVFWIMCKKRQSRLGIEVVSASIQDVKIKIEAEGSHTGYNSSGEFSVGYLDGTMFLEFSNIMEYSSRIHKDMQSSGYPNVRFYEYGDSLVFEASDFFHEDYFLRIICKTVKVLKEIHNPLFK